MVIRGCGELHRLCEDPVPSISLKEDSLTSRCLAHSFSPSQSRLSLRLPRRRLLETNEPLKEHICQPVERDEHPMRDIRMSESVQQQLVSSHGEEHGSDDFLTPFCRHRSMFEHHQSILDDHCAWGKTRRLMRCERAPQVSALSLSAPPQHHRLDHTTRGEPPLQEYDS